MTIFLLLAIGLLFVPVPAFAFGPVAHVDFGLQILAQSGALAAGVGALIRRNRREFLLGTLDPDRVLAKNLARYSEHTHNWSRVFAHLRAAGNESERAKLFGQVCHLAADCVAHNYFVPAKMTEAYAAPLARHTYWEMRYDARLRRLRGEDVLASMGLKDAEHSRYLATQLMPTIPGRRFNVGVTGLGMRLQARSSFVRATDTADLRARLPFTDDELAEVEDLALAAQMAALEDLADADLVLVDPRGIASIRHSLQLRRQLRVIHAEREPVDVERVLRESRDHFRSLLGT